MRLHLPFDASWQLSEGPDRAVVAVSPHVIITSGPPELAPDQPDRWRQRAARDLPAGTHLAWGQAEPGTTAAGWPLTIAVADLRTERGEHVEARLCAFYTFMEHAVIAIARAAQREHLDDGVRALLTGGRPDWRDGPACLADVWDLVPP